MTNRPIYPTIEAKDKPYTIYNTAEYDDWLHEEPAKSQVQIRSRISHIQDEGYFGDHKSVGNSVWELRWKNGRRIYYAYIPLKKVLLLLGGNKNGQEKDISHAKKIYNKYAQAKNTT